MRTCGRRRSRRSRTRLNFGRRGFANDRTGDVPRRPMRRQVLGRPTIDVFQPTLRQAWPPEWPEAAMCVQDVDVQCVLQFTLVHAAGCALHRHTSRVIHRSELYHVFGLPPTRRPPRSRADDRTNKPYKVCLRNEECTRSATRGGRPVDGPTLRTSPHRGRHMSSAIAHPARQE